MLAPGMEIMRLLVVDDSAAFRSQVRRHAVIDKGHAAALLIPTLRRLGTPPGERRVELPS